MAKAPFERIFSLIERKKILQRAAKERVKVIVKSLKNEIYQFQTFGLEGGQHLEGLVTAGKPKDFEKVTALFYVDGDRYFVTTRIKKKGENFLLLNDAQFYKFNRRAAYRIKVPAFLEVSFFISTIRNIEVNRKVPILEFSSGGAKIYWDGNKRFTAGTILRGSLQWGNGKVQAIEASVVHSPEQGVYGLRFVNLTAMTIARLKMLSVEIQQELYFHQMS